MALLKIGEIANAAGIDAQYVEPYGFYKAKIDTAINAKLTNKADGKLVLVTAITPTVVNGTIHNTQFVLCHKLVRIGDGVLIKVMRSPLHFFRSLRTTVVATNGEEHHVAIITTKAHFRTNSTAEHRGSKTLPPLLLYILAQYGFEETMRKFGFEEQISISQFQDTEDPVYSYYEIKPDIFVKVNTEAMNDIYFERVVGSLIYILNLSVGFIRSEERRVG